MYVSFHATPKPPSELAIQQAYTWEASYTRSWDTVQEDEAGSLQGAVEGLMARSRRRRHAHQLYPPLRSSPCSLGCSRQLPPFDVPSSDISFSYSISQRP
jgi:hypothetical protein